MSAERLIPVGCQQQPRMLCAFLERDPKMLPLGATSSAVVGHFRLVPSIVGYCVQAPFASSFRLLYGCVSLRARHKMIHVFRVLFLGVVSHQACMCLAYV